MAEFNCFVTEEDIVELLQKALGDGFKIYLDKTFPSPIAEVCADAEAVRGAVKHDQYAFLLEHPRFSRYPVGLRPIERNGERCWYPRSKEGGPVIEVHFFAPFNKGDLGFIPCSLLAYHTKIINPVTEEFEPAGEEIRRAFAALTSIFRRGSRRVRSKTRSAYVLPRVDAMLASGWNLAQPFTSAQ
jgi:hypothetical protein